MSNHSTSGEHRAAAQALGLKVPAYLHLRQAYLDGEAPIWLRSADPKLAGLFQEDAFAFELLWERIGMQLGLDRRRANLMRLVEKGERHDLVEPLARALDEGELEDYSFGVEPSPAPEGEEALEDEKLAAYVQALRGCHITAASLRQAFREHGLIKVAATGKEGVDINPFQALVDSSTQVRVLPPAKYLQIRRGERAHALIAEFDLPLAELKKVFEQSSFPAQERERYFKLFQNFVQKERLPRLAQEARANLKRNAETASLRNAWEQLEFSINRGRHSGSVVGICAIRGGKVQVALINEAGEYQRSVLLSTRGDGLMADLQKFLGDDVPSLLAYQGDTASRNLAQKLSKGFRSGGAAKAVPVVKVAAAEPVAVDAPVPTPTPPADPKAVVAPDAPAAEPAATSEAAPTSEVAEAAQPPVEPQAVAPAPAPAPEKAAPAPEKTAPAKDAPKQPKGKKQQKIRMAHVPIAVARTLQREVARRGAETLLSHDERQAYLLARFAWDPKSLAMHTPHVVRAFISFRGEINHRRLEEFEVTFLRSLLLEKGIDLNTAPMDVLRMIPGVDAEGVMIERSTGAFLSLADYQDRMGPTPQDWRACACLLRVRGSDQVLDSRRLHPVYYPVIEELAQASDMRMAELLRSPVKVNNLNWEPVLEGNRWRRQVVGLIRDGLERGQRRRKHFAPRPANRGIQLDALEVGSTVKGKVTALTDYGAFVDIGANTEGLVHISEMADSFVKDPSTILKAGQEVEARVLSVDIEKQRFRLSLRSESSEGGHEEFEHAAAGPAYVRSTRPRSAPGKGRGGPRGGDRDGRGGGRKRGERIPPDPKKSKKEEIDPTNPFFVFFNNKDD